MDATATSPYDPIAAAWRAYLRPFVQRAAWAAVFAAVIGIFLLLLLFMAMEPFDQLLDAMDDHKTLKTSLIAFWFCAGVTLIGTLICGVVAVARSRDLFGQNPTYGATSMLGAMKGTQIVGGIAFFVFLATLALPLRSVDDSSFFDAAPNATPPETVQFMLFLITGGIAVMLLLNRRATVEIRRTLLGGETTRRAAFEVLMPQAGVAFSNQPIAATAANMEMPAPAAPSAPALLPSMQSAMSAAAVSYPAASGLVSMTGSSGDPGAGRPWDRLVAALLLMIIGLSVTHLWTLYAFRKEFKDTKTWNRLYAEYSEVPEDPRLSKNNYANMNGRPFGYSSTRYNGVPGRFGPATQKKSEPLAGLAAVCVMGGSLTTALLQAAAVLWAAICIVSGARLRILGLLTAWTMLICIAIALLAHAYLLQEFKFAPEQAAMLGFMRSASQGEFREILRLNSPTDLSIKQLAIPLAMILVLSGERVGRMLRGQAGEWRTSIGEQKRNSN